MNSIDLQELIDDALKPANKYGFRVARDEVLIPRGEHLLDHPVSLRNAYGLDIYFPVGAHLIANWTDPTSAILDLRGAVECDIVGKPRIRTNNGCLVGTALFLARNPSVNGAVPASSGFHGLMGLKIEGSYAVATAVVAGSECNTWTSPRLYNDAGGSCLYIGNDCPRIAIPHGKSTMQQQSFYDTFLCQQGEQGGPAIRFNMTGGAIVSDINFYGGGMSVQVPREAAVVMSQGGAPGQMQDIHFDGMRWETDGCDHAILCNERGQESHPRSVVRVALRDSTVISRRECIDATGQYLRGWEASGLNAVIANGSPYQNEAQRYALIAADPSSSFNFPTGTNQQKHLFNERMAVTT